MIKNKNIKQRKDKFYKTNIYQRFFEIIQKLYLIKKITTIFIKKKITLKF